MIAADIPDLSATYVPVGRTLTAGAGLTGGGDLSANRTFDVVGGTGITANANDVAITNTAVTPAAYGDATHVGTFTVDQQGRLTAAADVAITGVTPGAHAAAHQNGGGDEISVAGLSGQLADLQNAGWLYGTPISALAPNVADLLAWGGGASWIAYPSASIQDHTPKAHVVNSTGPHAESGLTIGHVLRVSAAAAFSFAALIAADIPDLSAVYVPVGRTVTAGNGLTGGGALSGNITVTLGTPGTLTVSTSNAVTADSHTHAITTTTAGAASTIVATDASGNVTATGYLKSGANMYLTDASTYLSRAAGALTLATDRALLYVNVNSASALLITPTYVRRTGATSTLGLVGTPWTNVYASAMNVTGNITVTGTVDGVNVSSHTHAVTTGVTAQNGAFTNRNIESTSNDLYFYCGGVGGAGAHWLEARLIDGKHTHASGTLSTGAPL